LVYSAALAIVVVCVSTIAIVLGSSATSLSSVTNRKSPGNASVDATLSSHTSIRSSSVLFHTCMDRVGVDDFSPERSVV
jgi:hypothetical protein